MRGADLRGTNLQHAKFYGADLTSTKITAAQAKSLETQGITGFVIVE